MRKIAYQIKRRIDYDEMEKQPVKVETPFILEYIKRYQRKLKEAQETRNENISSM